MEVGRLSIERSVRQWPKRVQFLSLNFLIKPSFKHENNSYLKFISKS